MFDVEEKISLEKLIDLSRDIYKNDPDIDPFSFFYNLVEWKRGMDIDYEKGGPWFTTCESPKRKCDIQYN